MRESSRIQIYEVVEETGSGGVCIVRCVGGVARVGQIFMLEASPNRPSGTVRLRLDRIERYGQDVDAFDVMHTAKVHLTGGTMSGLVRGSILAAGPSAPADGPEDMA
ncbi:hypothetical protein ACFWU3_08485 [Streptomyces sp. NPDC058685]|uniref:hypothetical protein n=1 Tax=Streptomyces sp. NPDC058685 TaxID=3346598 RepID=UPI003663E848